MQLFLKLVQLAVFIFVMGSNGKWQWTPNGYVAGLVAFFAALLATTIILDSLRFYRWLLGSLKRLQHD